MIISSIDNDKIKKYSKLSKKKYRDSLGLYLVEGEHLVQEALKVGNVEEVFILEGSKLDYDGTYVTLDVMKKLSSMDTPSNIVCVCRKNNNNDIIGKRLLLLDEVQDPGNLGTIIRSSVAFNIDTIVLSNDTVDLYNDKVIRSTQGLLFHLNIIRRDLVEVINELKEKGYDILGTNVHNGTNLSEIKTNKFALLMGNEGQGLKEELQSMCDKNIYIPMNNNCESLNVAVATSIILYELNK